LRRKKRALRKIERARSIDPSIFIADTVTISDTIFIESVKHDTVTKIIKHDTVTVIDNERLIVKYYYDSTRQEIWHEGECKDSVIVVEKQVPVERIKPLTHIEKIKDNLIFYLFCLALIIYLIFDKKNKI
jgi:hypothetical protein